MKFHETEAVELKKSTSELKEAVISIKRKSYELTKPESVGDTSQKTSVKTSVKILGAIAEDNRITIPELAKLAGVTVRSVERNIQRLQLENRLRRVGPDKGGHWEIV